MRLTTALVAGGAMFLATVAGGESLAAPVQPVPAVCTAADLEASLGETEGTAGTVYRALVFTNRGHGNCVIQGFPRVSFVGDGGRQVGEAAVPVGEAGRPVVVAPGRAAAAPVGFVVIWNFDPEVCRPTPVRGLRVYPPHQWRSEVVPFDGTGCAGDVPGSQLLVYTVHPGSGLT